MEEAGFYKAMEGSLLFGVNRVQHKDFLLIKEEKDTYDYPIQGWYWFDTLKEAENFFISQGWEKPEEID